VESSGGAVSRGRGRGEAARVGGDALKEEGEEARGGRGGGTARGSRRRRGRAALEVGDGPDRWAPPVGGCEREMRWEAGALVERAAWGERWLGRRWVW
jgi:hypothetical protein